MHQHRGRDDCKIIHHHFACQLRWITDDTAIAHQHIVCNVHTLHQQVIRANNSFTFGCRATVNGHVFADDVVIAHLSSIFFSLELQVLRDGTNYSTREERIALADARSVKHGDAVHQAVIFSNHHIFIDVAKRTDFAALANHSFGMHVC